MASRPLRRWTDDGRHGRSLPSTSRPDPVARAARSVSQPVAGGSTSGVCAIAVTSAAAIRRRPSMSATMPPRPVTRLCKASSRMKRGSGIPSSSMSSRDPSWRRREAIPAANRSPGRPIGCHRLGDAAALITAGAGCGQGKGTGLPASAASAAISSGDSAASRTRHAPPVRKPAPRPISDHERWEPADVHRFLATSVRSP
jgi:hypothetical protein